MRKDPIVDLLTEIQQLIDAVCEDLIEENRQDIVRCIKRDSAWIPPIEKLERGVLPSRTIRIRKLRPLLYDALEEGLVDARHFDALMVERAMAERALGAKEP